MLERVLVVDDDDGIRRLLERLLRLAGVAEVRTVVGGDDIAQVVGSFDPDLVLLDLHLGGDDGLEVLASIAASDPEHGRRPTVLITGDLGPDVVERAHLLGAEVLAKPFSKEDVSALVERAIGWRGVSSTDRPPLLEHGSGRGGTFTAARAEPEVAAAAGAPRSTGAPRTVLYVEDVVTDIRLMELILQRRPDITLVPAMLGRLALDLARDNQPDLVLLDLNLPDLDGAEVLSRLRADPRTQDIPVVVLTADAEDQRLQRLMAAGARAYLTKPIDVAHLLDLMDEVFAA